jgi:hypothetical protein
MDEVIGELVYSTEIPCEESPDSSILKIKTSNEILDVNVLLREFVFYDKS